MEDPDPLTSRTEAPAMHPSAPADRTRPIGPTVLLALALAAPAATAIAQAPPDPVAASTPARTTPVADLTHRYRFAEPYAGDDPAGLGAGAVARVGVVEIVKDAIDVPRGAPRRSEIARQLVFLERPTEVSAPGGPASSIRVFERYQTQPGDAAEAVTPRFFDGLSAWCRPRVGENPAWLSLTEGRRLRDGEYEVAARTPFLPQVAGILPPQPVRIGDTWRIPRRAAQALLGEPTGPIDALSGKLTAIRRDADGPALVGVIGITGRLDGPATQTAVNAEALFTGLPGPAAASPVVPTRFDARAPAAPAADAGVIDARGGITEIRLARSLTGLLPGPGRLRYRTTREVVVRRRLAAGPEAEAAVPRPAALPAATEANAQLVYLDPQGRYRFAHAQDLLPPDPYQLVAGGVVVNPDTATLTRARRDGHDLLQFEFVQKVVGPEELRARMAAKWGTGRVEVMKGGEEWLPEAEWPRMKVHRIEAAIKAPERGAPGGSVPRIHFDGYLIQCSQTATILAVATTSRDDVAGYRREIEALLRSLEVNPGRAVEG